MTEYIQGNLGSTGEQITIEDPQPLESARLFKHISDAIWEQRPERHSWTMYAVPSTLDPEDSLRAVNDVVGGIKKRLAVTSGKNGIRLSSGYPDEHIAIPAEQLLVPEHASVETFNWDQRMDYRQIIHNGKRDYIRFTDDHRDYYRELSAKFHFQVDPGVLVVSYTMQRSQPQQGSVTDLSTNVWYSGFAETGYEGHQSRPVELTEAQEFKVLTLLAHIGGIAVEPPSAPNPEA